MALHPRLDYGEIKDECFIRLGDDHQINTSTNTNTTMIILRFYDYICDASQRMLVEREVEIPCDETMEEKRKMTIFVRQEKKKKQNSVSFL